VLHCPNRLTQWRVETYFTKEPETIEWIDSFHAQDLLFDIGANIGLYSIYAAKNNIRVIAFEPESQNYALINKNIHLNKLHSNILCLNIALSNENKLDYLHIPKFTVGGALNNFGEAKDWKKDEFSPDFKQGAISFALDSFIELFPRYFPNHIKIDVDGIEEKIILGAENTLKDDRLKSLLIELNDSLNQDMQLIGFIEKCGLQLKHKKHSTMFEGTEYESVYNYIFERK